MNRSIFINLFIIAFIMFTIFFMTSIQAWSATYYVRADGTAKNKENATGPASNPSSCMNIFTLNKESPKGTVYISDQGGEFNLDIDYQSNTTYKALPGESPTFTLLEEETDWYGPDKYGNYMSNGYGQDQFMLLIEDNVRIFGANGYHNGISKDPSQLQPGQWTVRNDTLYYKPTSGNPLKHTVKTFYTFQYFPSIDKETHNVTIDGLTFYGSPKGNLSGKNNTIKNCEFYWQFRAGLDVNYADGCQVLNTSIHDQSARGLLANENVTNCIFDNLHIYNISNKEHDFGNEKGDGQGVTLNGKGIWKNNTLSNSVIEFIGWPEASGPDQIGDSIGILCDGCDGTTITNNVVREAAKTGICVENHKIGEIGASPHDVTVSYNTVIDCGWFQHSTHDNVAGLSYVVGGPGKFEKATNIKFLNNTVYRQKAYSISSWKNAFIAIYTRESNEVMFKDNILHGEGAYFVQMDDMLAGDKIVLDNNKYYGTYSKGMFMSNGNVYNDIKQLCSNEGFECNGQVGKLHEFSLDLREHDMQKPIPPTNLQLNIVSSY